jgi:hypothetical protein
MLKLYTVLLADLVRDFAISMHAADDLRLSQRKLVDLFRASRPTDLTSQSEEWTVADESPLGRYISSTSINHIKDGWSTDEPTCIAWLLDCPQDQLVRAVAANLGFEKCSELALQAQSAGDAFKFAKLASAAGVCARTVDRDSGVLPRSLELERAAIDALGALQDHTAETKDDHERLEIEMLSNVFAQVVPDDFKYLPRVYSTTTPDECTVGTCHRKR